MGATHHLAVVAVDESGAALKLSSAKLTSGAAVNRGLAFGGAARNTPQPHPRRVPGHERRRPLGWRPMTPVTSSSEPRPGRVRGRLRSGLAAALLLASACREPGPGAVSVDAGPAPVAASETAPPADAGGAPEPSPGTGAAKRLKAEASTVVAARLVSCQDGQVRAEMPAGLLKQLQSALAQAEVSQDTALTPPPWESAVLELKLRVGPPVFGLLVREDVLRVSAERRCGGPREPGSELRLDAGLPLLPWFQQHLGPVEGKAHRLPPGLPPPP
jgi:hypothetical protein